MITKNDVLDRWKIVDVTKAVEVGDETPHGKIIFVDTLGRGYVIDKPSVKKMAPAVREFDIRDIKPSGPQVVTTAVEDREEELLARRLGSFASDVSNDQLTVDEPETQYSPEQFPDDTLPNAADGHDEHPIPPGGYKLEIEGDEVGSVMTRVGLNYVMSPIDPGIAPAGRFTAPRPGTTLGGRAVRKHVPGMPPENVPAPVRKRSEGLFNNIIRQCKSPGEQTHSHEV